MERSPLFLAALASAAVPGLDPASVEAVPSHPGQLFDIAFVQDTQHRRWVVRAPRTRAAGAQMDVTVALLGLLARRLPFAVPTPKGFAALKDGGRAAVYPYLPGQTLDFAALPAGPGLAAEVGRTLAALHNADLRLFEEAGLPAYDADEYRTRRLAELDRAASTGHVPTGLLARWERMLEDVSLWRFAPTPTHGDLTGDQVLVVFDDEADAASGRVRALTGWEDAKVADPADDFADLVAQAPADALETVLEAYAHARVERPDAHLLARARLAAQMQRLSALMAALADDDRLRVERCAAGLRRLDEHLAAEAARDEADDYRRAPGLRPGRPSRVVVPPTLAADDDEADDVAVMFARTAEDGGPDADATPGTVPDAVPETTPDAAPDTAPDALPATEPEGVPTTAPEGAPDSRPLDAAPQPAPAAEGASTQPIPVQAPATAVAGTSASARSEPEGEPEPEPIEGPDPGPEFEPGYTPR